MTTTINIIPKPMSVKPGEGQFELNAQTRIVATGEALSVAEMLAEYFRPATGFPLEITANGNGSNTIMLAVTEEAADLNDNGYKLHVTPDGIMLQSAAAVGLFRGLQSLRQLFPPEIEQSEQASDVTWVAPAVSIVDEPIFRWRGLHLDVARHFFSVDYIKRFIDLMVLHKYNIFHWHLTEDQGWRIEIKQYPKLTEIGANRAESAIPSARHQRDGIPYGGFYTQDDVREVVAYAQARHITVVPEIEMPGHALAALASYPELGCRGEGYEVWTGWGISEEVFCAGNEDVFTFLQNVLTEVLELFPSEFIHVGGDECPKARWEACPKCQTRIKEEGLADEHELQSYFIRRMEKWLNERGRRLIGWDEILEGGLPPNATVMSWRGNEGGIAAANAGHDVVMSPTTHCYFDYYQSKNTDKEPPAIGDFLPLERVYDFNPIPENIAEEKAHHVLGVQGNIWTEYLTTEDLVDYMAYPRAVALAEVGWSDLPEHDFEEFLARLMVHLKRLDVLGVQYRKYTREV